MLQQVFIFLFSLFVHPDPEICIWGNEKQKPKTKQKPKKPQKPTFARIISNSKKNQTRSIEWNKTRTPNRLHHRMTLIGLKQTILYSKRRRHINLYVISRGRRSHASQVARVTWQQCSLQHQAKQDRYNFSVQRNGQKMHYNHNTFLYTFRNVDNKDKQIDG